MTSREGGDGVVVTRDGETGRFLPLLCDDPNCDGILAADLSYRDPTWRCNGLTHDTPEGELRACMREFPRRLTP